MKDMIKDANEANPSPRAALAGLVVEMTAAQRPGSRTLHVVASPDPLREREGR